MKRLRAALPAPVCAMMLNAEARGRRKVQTPFPDSDLEQASDYHRKVIQRAKSSGRILRGESAAIAAAAW
jgi:hypothetical protein